MVEIKETKSIFVITFRRPNLLRLCLESLRKASGVEDFQVVLVAQNPTDEIREVIEEYGDLLSITIETDGSAFGVETNINRNRLLAME